MKLMKNEGNTDRIIRIVLGVAILGVGLVTQSWLGLIGLVPLVTGAVGTCPVYMIFGISTCPVQE